MVAVRWLEPDVAEDLALAPAVVDVVNRAYAHTEVGLFATKIERTDIDDVRTSISRRETAVALLEGEVVGSVRARVLDGRTGWFGALGVDPAVHGRGFGGALVRFAEDDAAAAGRGAMQLEMLESQPIHPHPNQIPPAIKTAMETISSRTPTRRAGVPDYLVAIRNQTVNRSDSIISSNTGNIVARAALGVLNTTV